MPIYEYQCRECGTVNEIFINMGDHSDTLTCKSCGSSDLVKKLSAASISTVPSRPTGKTCCGRDERCDKPPCGDGGCRR